MYKGKKSNVKCVAKHIAKGITILNIQHVENVQQLLNIKQKNKGKKRENFNG